MRRRIACGMQSFSAREDVFPGSVLLLMFFSTSCLHTSREDEKHKTSKQLTLVCSRLIDKDGKTLRGWTPRSGLRPPTLSDFLLPAEEWPICHSSAPIPGTACALCLQGIATALRTSGRLQATTRPYIQVELDKTKMQKERSRIAHKVP